MKSPQYQNLKKLNTFSIDIYTNNFLRISGYDDIISASEIYHNYPHVFIIGGGSNVILSENVIDALVIKNDIFGISIISDDSDFVTIEVGSGEIWHDLVCFCLRKGWYGLENLALIPGTVGGAPIQNIGAYGVEFSEYCHSVVVWDFANSNSIEIDSKDCLFSYRDSIFKQKHNYFITSVRLTLNKMWKPRITYSDISKYLHVKNDNINLTPEFIFDMICNIRRNKLPDTKILGNVGSFFKNPIVNLMTLKKLQNSFSNVVFWPINLNNHYKISAGWLIDTCGWRGRSIGSVGVYDKQSLVLINIDDANSNDVLSLACKIQSDVLQKTGICLEIEPSIF